MVVLSSCSEEDNSTSIADEQTIEIGNGLADWANSNCKLISVDNKNILWQGSNAGGCSAVYFEFRVLDRDAYFDLEALETWWRDAGIEEWLIEREIVMRQSNLNRENEVKENLKSAVNSSKCQVSELISNINSLESSTDSELVAQYLGCMGDIEISEGAFGSGE